MVEEEIEAEVIEAKVIGSNVVMFNLTDGARIKATVNISTVLRAKELNPDEPQIQRECECEPRVSATRWQSRQSPTFVIRATPIRTEAARH